MNRLREALLRIRLGIRARLSKAARAGSETANTRDGGDPNPLAESTVVAYFGSPGASLYQFVPWLDTLEELHRTHPVTIVVREHTALRELRGVTKLPILYVHGYRELSRLVAEGQIRLFLYVNHASSNYQMLRFNRPLHVQIGHGESDKEYMASHQAKAYDFTLVAGRAGADRLAEHVFRLSRDTVIEVGRPQVSVAAFEATDPPTLLYAPTYEGDIAGSSYTSVPSIGPSMVEMLLESGRYTVIYRPHPLTGVHSAEVGKADATIRRLIDDAGTPHSTDTESPLHELMSRASLLISDRSSVVIDWLAHGRPFLVTSVNEGPFTAVERAGIVVDASNVQEVVSLVDSALSEDHQQDERKRLAIHHLGQTQGPESRELFLQTIGQIIELQRSWAEGAVASGDGEPRDSGSPLQ